jgi:hypothetical protein
MPARDDHDGGLHGQGGRDHRGGRGWYDDREGPRPLSRDARPGRCPGGRRRPQFRHSPESGYGYGGYRYRRYRYGDYRALPQEAGQTATGTGVAPLGRPERGLLPHAGRWARWVHRLLERAADGARQAPVRWPGGSGAWAAGGRWSVLQRRRIPALAPPGVSSQRLVRLTCIGAASPDFHAAAR